MFPGSVDATQQPVALAAIFAAIDAENAQDPRHTDTPDGPVPNELLDGRRMSARLDGYAPDASAELRVAVRAQHLRRWEIPRKDFAEGRDGYLAWRKACAAHHSRVLEAILRGLLPPLPEEFIARTCQLVRKDRFRTDPEGQILEDVACLVFVEHHLTQFAAAHPAEKVADIVRKTARKMSAAGKQALAELAAATLPAALRSTLGL